MQNHDLIRDQVRSTATVCCMVGLPGSGKSTIAKVVFELNHPLAAQQDFDLNSSVSHYDDVVLIDYDNIAATENELQMRSCCAPAIAHGTSLELNELEAWRKSRKIAVGKLKDALTTHFSNDNAASSLLIILDDNFHLRSMRREIYQSCQEIVELIPRAKIGFSVVHCSTPLDICIRRNDLRSGKQCISREIIHRMDKTLEPPDGTKGNASFERFHTSINAAEDTDTKIDGNSLSALFKCLSDSLQLPVLPKNKLTREEIIELDQKRARDREKTIHCYLQRMDQLLRKLVSVVGRMHKEKTKEANEIRKSILLLLRQSDDLDSSTFDDFVAQKFLISILGEEVREMSDNPLAMAINETVQKFEMERNDVT